MLYLRQINFKRVIITVLAAAVAVPVLTMANSRNKIFVDANATGRQTGSSSHPYKTIAQALSRTSSYTRIYLRKGTYHENVTLPKGVELYGIDDSDSVIIDARDENSPAITLKGGAKIVRVTVRDGKNGIRTADDGKVKIVKCNIKDNHKEGIYIDGNDTKEGNQVSITDSNIENNGDNGIFSERRRIAVEDSRIKNNGSDGISLSIGADAWIKENSIRKNSGSGIKARLDEASSLIKDNTINDNEQEGIEVISFGKSGRIEINKSAIRHNGDYGIRRVSRDSSDSVWDGLVIRENVGLSDNDNGNVSPILKFQ